MENNIVYINEVYETISGEAGIFPQGTWCTIIRFQGCNLRCSYCDTKKGQEVGRGQPVDLQKLASNVKTNHVMITGGEPLVQKEALRNLVDILESMGRKVQIETNGSLPPIKFRLEEYKGPRWVVDYKLNNSEEYEEMPPPKEFARRWKNIGVIKFVVGSWGELAQSIEIMKEMKKVHPFTFIISPLDANADLLVDFIRRVRENNPDQLREGMVFSLQMHKLVKMP